MEDKDIKPKSGGDFSDIFLGFRASNPPPEDKSADLLTGIVIHPKPEPGSNFKLENILRQTEYVIFNKPNPEAYNSSLVYEIILEDENHNVTGMLSVIKRTSSRFQPRCDFVLLTKDGETLLRLINPKRLIHKIKVLTQDVVVGSIIKSRLNIFGPQYRIRDADKTEIATITSSRKYCCLTCQKLCCGDKFGVFQVIQKVRHQLNSGMEKKITTPGNNNVTEPSRSPTTPQTASVTSIDSNGDILLGVVCRDVTFNDLAGHAAIMEINFEKGDVPDFQLKCLIIAAAIFVDLSVFVPQSGQADVKIIISTGIVLALIFGLCWVGSAFM